MGRAERRYQEGVSAIAEAKQKKQEWEDALSNPDVHLSPDEQIVADQFLKYYGDLSTLTPTEALAYKENHPEPVGFRVSRTPVQATGGTGAGGGTGRPPEGSQKLGKAFAESSGVSTPPGQPKPSTGNVSAGFSTTTTVEPGGMFLSRLRQRAAQGERDYQMSVTEQGQQAVLFRDQQGFQHQIKLAELNHINDLESQGRAIEAQRALAELASTLGIKEAEVQNALDMARDNNSFSNQLSLTESAQTWDTINKLAADLKDPTVDPDATLGQLRDLLANPSLSDNMRNRVQGLLSNASQDLAENYLKTREASLAELDAAMKKAVAEGSIAPEMAQLRLAQARADVTTAQLNVQLTSQKITIGGQQIKLNDLAIDGQTALNKHNEWTYQRAQVEAGNADAVSSGEFVKNAIEAGDVGTLQELLAIVTHDPSANMDLKGMTVGVSEATLRQAIDMASKVRGNADLQLQAVKQAAQNQLYAGQFEKIQTQATIADILGNTYTADEIDELRKTDPELARLFDTGQLPNSVIRAAKSKANYNDSIRENTVNAPRIEVVNGNLARLAQAPDPQDYDQAEVSVRREAQRLVELGALSPDAVEGMVAQYRHSWEMQNQTQDMNMRTLQEQILTSQAQRQQMLATAETARLKALAEVNKSKNAPSMDLDTIKFLQDNAKSVGDSIMDQAALAGCTITTGAGALIASEKPECAGYVQAARDNQADIASLGNYILHSSMGGAAPPTYDDPTTGDQSPITLGGASDMRNLVEAAIEARKMGVEVPPQVVKAIEAAQEAYGSQWLVDTFGVTGQEAIDFLNSVDSASDAAPTAEEQAAAREAAAATKDPNRPDFNMGTFGGVLGSVIWDNGSKWVNAASTVARATPGVVQGAAEFLYGPAVKEGSPGSFADILNPGAASNLPMAATNAVVRPVLGAADNAVNNAIANQDAARQVDQATLDRLPASLPDFATPSVYKANLKELEALGASNTPRVDDLARAYGFDIAGRPGIRPPLHLRASELLSILKAKYGTGGGN